MINFKVKLDGINGVKSFCNIAAKVSYDIDIHYGRFVIDGKSIMGLFSLDLSNKLSVVIHTDDDFPYKEVFKDFIVE